MDIDQQQLLELGTRYGIPILKALVILVVGWLIAKGAAFVARKGLEKTTFDNKLADKITGGKGSSIEVEKGVSKLVYWLLMLLVLMAVFQVLNLTIITEPLNALVTKVTTFLPQILAAAALALIAWAVASALRIVVRNLLGAFKLDEKIGEQAGEETKKISLAGTLAEAVYYLVFLLFLPQILDALQMDGLSPVKDMVGEILAFLPNLLGAVVLFFIFYFVARMVQRLVTNLLTTVGFNKVPELLGFDAPKEEKASASAIVGYVVLTILLFIGGIQAFKTLGLVIVSELADDLLVGLFDILVAVVIFGFGLFLARLAHKALSSGGQSPLLATVARAAILIFTGAMALSRTGLAQDIVNLAFGTVILGLALGGALAFGLGGREAAARTIEEWRGKQGEATKTER